MLCTSIDAPVTLYIILLQMVMQLLPSIAALALKSLQWIYFIGSTNLRKGKMSYSLTMNFAIRITENNQKHYSADASVGAEALCTCTAGCITILHEYMQVTIIHVVIQCSQGAALCTQAEQYLQLECWLCTQQYNEHMHNLGVCQSKHVISKGQGCCAAKL